MRFAGLALCVLVTIITSPEETAGFTTSSSFSSFNTQTHLPRRTTSSTTTTTTTTLTATIVNGESGTTTSDSSAIPSIRLTTYEKARTVTSVCTSGTLCTSAISSEIEGAPFGSYVDYVLDDDGNPVLLMNEMSMHTVNICQKLDDSSSSSPPLVTLFTQLGSSSQDVSRCSVTGTIERIPPDAQDMDALRMRYAINHAYADRVMDSPKFDFYRIRPRKIYYVGGFGVTASWVPVEEYRDAAPDILAREASAIVEKLNREHGGDLELVGVHFLSGGEVPQQGSGGGGDNLEDVVVTGVDRLGMDIRVTRRVRRNKLSTDEFRVGFRIPVLSVEDAKSEILKIFQEAWEKGQGYTWGEDESPGSDVPIVKIAEDSLG